MLAALHNRKDWAQQLLVRRQEKEYTELPGLWGDNLADGDSRTDRLQEI